MHLFHDKAQNFYWVSTVPKARGTDYVNSMVPEMTLGSRDQPWDRQEFNPKT